MSISLAFVLHRVLPHRVSPTIRKRKLAAALAAALLLPLLAAPPLLAQQNNPAPQQPAIPGLIPVTGNGQSQDPTMHRMLERMAGERNDERQKKIVAESARLLKMAKQLNADVVKSNKNTLSVPVVKEAEEIEKLAKNIKEQMSNGD